MNTDKEIKKPAFPNYLSPFYETIMEIFFQNVRFADENNISAIHGGLPMYWEWVSTSRIYQQLGADANYSRRALSNLEKLGVIEAQREKNYIKWAIKDLEGFVQHPIFKDYLQRVK